MNTGVRNALHPRLLELREHEALSNLQIEGEPLDVSGRCFGPLATRDNHITVALDILFLRAGHPGQGTQHGDIDDRLKTSLDASSAPPNSQALGESQLGLQPGELRMTLVEDDHLLTAVDVRTDRLLDARDPRGTVDVGWGAFVMAAARVPAPVLPTG